jgi:glucosamine-6-phosphate deaminase
MTQNSMHYELTREELIQRASFPLTIVPNHAALNAEVARRIADLIIANNAHGAETTLILPVGPVQYEPLADICNRERIDLSRLTFFMMDEYLEPDGQRAIAPSHPLSFQGFMKRSFVERVDLALGFLDKRVIFPVPSNMQTFSDEIMQRGGVDLCIAGVGISGHLAFNDPPEPSETDKDLNWVRNCVTRIVQVNRESCTQMAVGGTHGNWDIIPRLAVTVGMKEILASKRILLCGMRTWHSGTVRRAMFGPVSRDCPASLLQEHPNVEVVLTELAARPPLVNVTLDTGEEQHE